MRKYPGFKMGIFKSYSITIWKRRGESLNLHVTHIKNIASLFDQLTFAIRFHFEFIAQKLTSCDTCSRKWKRKEGCNLHGPEEQDVDKKLFGVGGDGGRGNAKDFGNLQTNCPKKRREQTCYNAFQKQ